MNNLELKLERVLYATVKQHEEMGFYDGWGKATEQLVEYTKTLR